MIVLNLIPARQVHVDALPHTYHGRRSSPDSPLDVDLSVLIPAAIFSSGSTCVLEGDPTWSVQAPYLL
jgi:hypothetical protein